MFGKKQDNEFSIKNKDIVTDSYYIKDLFEEIEGVEYRLKNLFKAGHSEYDTIKQELISLINWYELFKEKTQGQNQSIENNYSFQLKEARDRINKLLKHAKKHGIIIGKKSLIKNSIKKNLIPGDRND